MRISHLAAMFYRRTKALMILALLSGTAFAQGVSLAKLNDGLLNFSPVKPGPANPGAVTASPVVANPLPETPGPHKFWDNENRSLFLTVAALSAADFAVTRANLQNG